MQYIFTLISVFSWYVDWAIRVAPPLTSVIIGMMISYFLYSTLLLPCKNSQIPHMLHFQNIVVFRYIQFLYKPPIQISTSSKEYIKYNGLFCVCTFYNTNTARTSLVHTWMSKWNLEVTAGVKLQLRFYFYSVFP